MSQNIHAVQFMSSYLKLSSATYDVALRTATHLVIAASLLPRGTSSLRQPVTYSQNKRIPRVLRRTVAAVSFQLAPKTAAKCGELHAVRMFL